MRLDRKPSTARPITVQASRAGWVQNASMMDPPAQSAEELINFFPTAAGLRLRGGRVLQATIANDVVQLMPYQGGVDKLFASDTANIYDVTSPADPEVSPSAAVTGLTSGDWAYTNFGTSAGQFQVIANGADNVRNYNGSAWSVPTINNVDTSTLSHVWSFKSRLFFVESPGLSAWYLPAGAIAGDASEFSLASVFSEGGSLLFGATWSLDSGEGLDDVCVFVTDQGEVAVYEGTDPSNAATFALVGVYKISVPLSKHAWFRAGGDIAIATEDGIISLQAAVQQDRAAVSRQAITYPIEDAWREAVTLRTSQHRFNTTVWHSQQLLMVSVPEDFLGLTQAFVCNVRTGAWCRYTNWDVQCSAVLNDQLYFGTKANTIYQAEQTGQDGEQPYTAYWLPKFAPQPSVTALNMARVVYRGNVNLAPELTGAVDFNTEFPPVPPAAVDNAGDVWGTAVFGVGVWGSASRKAETTEWQSIAGVGREVSAWVASTSGRNTLPDIEIIGVEYVVERGRLF